MLEYREAKVIENREIAPNVFMLSVEGIFKGQPGQFYMLRAWDKEPLLSRPISIHDVTEDKIVFVYQVVGEGTKILSKLNVGENIQLTGPLGNYFPIEKCENKKIALVAGGIGTAPMYLLAKELKGDIDYYAGFRTNPYLLEKFEKYVNNISVSTEDGSFGHKGFITEILKPEDYDIVLCCGPEIMMNKVVSMCIDKDVEVYVSMEKHMACGIGACLVCTCKTKNGNKRTCKDGPVFRGKDLVL